MSSGVTLSSATRSNLLSLQDTAGLTATTQQRLSTGKKVNSAIDNASNYFTAAGLSSRSSALSTLLDGISNGIQTIQAASKGIDGILKLTAQLKSTAQQALASSNAFTSKASSTATLAGAVSGNILSSGGTVATAQNALGSSSTAAAATATGSAVYNDGRATLTGSGGTFSAAGPANFTINGTTIDLSGVTSETDIISTINAASGTTGVTASDASGQIKLTGKNDGGQITVTNASNTGLSTTPTTNGAGTASQSLTINGTTINYATGSTEAQVIAAINAQTSTTGVTASDSSGSLVLTGAADGSSFTVKGSNTKAGFTTAEATKTGTFHPTGATLASAIGFKTGDTFSVNNLAVTVGAGDTLDSLAAKVSTATGGDVSASFDATNRKFVFTAKTGDTAINLSNGSTATGLVSNLGYTTTHYDAGLGTTGALNSLSGKNLTVKVGTGSTATQTTISFGTGSSQVNTLDELNAALADAHAQASIDATTGKLSVTTTNEAGAEDLNLSGTGSSVFSAASSSAVIGGDGNTSRNKLVTDYNNLLTQIDQLSADSGFNGVNLLSGDTVKVIFNEKNTSSVSIKGVATDSSTLGLDALGNTDFQDATKINEVLDQVSSANSTLNSLSATFGTNLSVVQNRQDFSKALINVLDTGASNLTDADLNEEAANSQALTTRQSLGISALSLANQAQQGILQLLR